MLPARFEDSGRDGFALVTSLLIILVLSLIAVAAIIVATTEKRTSFAETVHATALFSADAGGEQAIHFLRMADRPPRILDPFTMRVDTLATTAMYDNPGQQGEHGGQTYRYECSFAGRNWIRGGGWEMNYANFEYAVDSIGETAAVGSRRGVRLVVGRIFREGY